MNDLLHHKLKKMNHKLKYEKVPFHEEHMQKAVFQGNAKQKKGKKTWIRKSAPVPFVALIVLICLNVSDTPSRTSIHTAMKLPEKSLSTELKVQKETAKDTATVERTSLMSSPDSSTMVRETYVIHNQHQYVQTGKRVKTEKLNEVVGTVKGNLTPGSTHYTSTSFFPETEIYSIKGKNEKEAIAIQSRRNTGIGATSVSKQGYFVFEKTQPLPEAQ